MISMIETILHEGSVFVENLFAREFAAQCLYMNIPLWASEYYTNEEGVYGRMFYAHPTEEE